MEESPAVGGMQERKNCLFQKSFDNQVLCCWEQSYGGLELEPCKILWPTFIRFPVSTLTLVLSSINMLFPLCILMPYYWRVMKGAKPSCPVSPVLSSHTCLWPMAGALGLRGDWAPRAHTPGPQAHRVSQGGSDTFEHILYYIWSVSQSMGWRECLHLTPGERHFPDVCVGLSHFNKIP